jgi:alkanesulfonate monooxygenase SsuD/methylene tetrahydromethanopterin reductase-like flavin-dependent oxidoreductase (luciferase family)
MRPGFVQRPRPPLTLAAHGPRTLAVAARFADTWNTFGPTLEEGRRLSDALDDACAEIGRDPGTIRRSVLLGLTEGTCWTSAAELGERVGAWHAAGFTDVVFYDPPYARAGVPCAGPEVVDEVLSELDTLR